MVYFTKPDDPAAAAAAVFYIMPSSPANSHCSQGISLSDVSSSVRSSSTRITFLFAPLTSHKSPTSSSKAYKTMDTPMLPINTDENTQSPKMKLKTVFPLRSFMWLNETFWLLRPTSQATCTCSTFIDVLSGVCSGLDIRKSCLWSTQRKNDQPCGLDALFTGSHIAVRFVPRQQHFQQRQSKRCSKPSQEMLRGHGRAAARRVFAHFIIWQNNKPHLSLSLSRIHCSIQNEYVWHDIMLYMLHLTHPFHVPFSDPSSSKQ